ncbi:SixA phosphatase family protein [Sphingomonas sp.]|uniref:SixA phosphatase family protein n=1 Tax=Sphingomonas sp. TaxID=28214 RepID=UPI002DD648B5|nr:histidine phosphatase family protein [Sphingomonas sp.]
MKSLTLLRHAKSGWDDPALRDFDRPLNAKGQRAAQVVGRNLRAMDLVFDRVVASPAVRVVETLDHVGRGYGAAFTPEWDRRLYLASVASLVDVVHEQDDGVGRLLLVGHNPGLEELVLALVPPGPASPRRGDVEDKFPTASVAVMRFAVDRWADVAMGGGTLIEFVRPRDLDAALGPDD